MSDTYVLVHGAWHSGETLEPTAQHLRAKGHVVHCPTLSGNRPGDDCSALGLKDAIDSLIQYIEQHDLTDVRLVGHSYGGMLVSAAADRIGGRIRRIIYANAFVPLPGESLTDMTPPHHKALFDAMAAGGDGAVTLPFEVWRENFINDADLALAQHAYEQLKPQPYRCFVDALPLSRPTAELTVGKSFLNCRQDVTLPHSLPWHPRLSERLGLFRYVEVDGSHELLFTNPARFAEAILMAARD
jgi:pimeloyl-ACP methyl ester carboxylesterase